MKPVLAVRATLLSVAISLALAGCSGNDSDEMSQEEIQYISHLDQSRFFQRQGELKASTLEARSAIELQPNRIEPYLVIVNNLLTAGDARNAERQLDQLLSDVGEQSISQPNRNKAALIRAEANLMQQEFDDALAALEELKEPDRVQQLEGALIKGDIHLAAGRLDAAREAYSVARDIDSGEAEPLIGLSKVAYSQNDPEQANKYIAQAEELNQDNVELWLWKGKVAQNEENWADAEQAYVNALETIGQYDIMTYQKFGTMSALINVLREQGKSSEAFVYEEILAKSAPGTIRSNLIAAQEAFNNGELNNAARYLEEVLAQAPSQEQAALMLGIIRYRQGRPEEAEALLAPVANMDDSQQARKLLAATRLQMRNPEGAKEILANLEDQDSDPETLALVGIASLVSGDTESGEQFIEKSLELAPDNNTLRLRYATYLVRTGKTDSAIEQANRVLETDPESEQARLLVVQAHVSSNNNDAAIAAASDWVKEQPESVAALITRGNVAANAENIQEAKQYYQRAVEADSENPAGLNALGNLARLRNETEQAKDYYRRAIELSPDNGQALQGISSVMPREELTALMERIRKQHPEAYGPRLILLESALVDDNTQRADDLTASLLERESESSPAPAESAVASVYHGIATQLAQRERLEQASDVLRRGRILFPENEEIGIQAAAIQFTQGNTKEARDILRDVKQQHPESAAPFRVEARYFERQEEYQEAAELYQLALELEQTAELEVAHARALVRSGQRVKAVESLENARQAFPRNPQILMNLAMLHQENEAPEKAIPPYEELLEVTPRNVVALNNLAWIYHQQGDERAMELARQAFELNSDNAAIADTYGWILFKAGQTEESLPVLEKAHELQPGSEEIAMHLAEAYRATGRDADAKRVLEKFGGRS
ncbi:tetratricopeptide repeat protein [Marinobacter panjinensis]|uniref:Tetratricopeptide repeat protein n=1 Tax=Marinobacter panjinensis TaxID=2576384 RepID=A0A4U6R0P8_9GAMM|nr:tetratricopeptide repeat protein [Marinobacter panjinensis]MCR8915837.1 tetratricopeptide repeat protein [Marinobacter panjinensis]TKV67187.1 tetratricopeptide repeat protein [Marinobacter panjinensis]